VNGRKAKEARKVTGKVTITFFSDQKIAVEGFYDNLDMALNQLHGGERAIIHHFMNKPKSNLIKLNA